MTNLEKPVGYTQSCIFRRKWHEKAHCYLRKTAELTGSHFLDAAGCGFNLLDGMHLTREGHRQLAKLLAETVPALL